MKSRPRIVSPDGSVGLVDRKNEQCERHKCRHDGYPENGAEVAPKCNHQANRNQRPNESADRIQTLAQAITGAADVTGRQIGNESVAGCASNSLSDAIDDSG